MSKSYKKTIRCPKCGEEYQTTIWQSINTKINPEMKERVLRDEAFIATCPKCGNRGLMEYDFLYHQPEDGIMIQYAAKDHVLQYEKTMEQLRALDGVKEEYPETLRIVTSREDLKDKILTFSEGLDCKVLSCERMTHIR